VVAWKKTDTKARCRFARDGRSHGKVSMGKSSHDLIRGDFLQKAASRREKAKTLHIRGKKPAKGQSLQLKILDKVKGRKLKGGHSRTRKKGLVLGEKRDVFYDWKGPSALGKGERTRRDKFE